MPSTALLAPAAVLVLGAGVGTGLAAGGLRLGRVPAATAAWLATAILSAIWLAGRAAQEMPGPQLGFGAPFSLRLDALSFAFSLFLLIPAALLLTLQARSEASAGGGAIATAAGLLVVLAGGFSLAALLLGVVIVAAMIQLRSDGESGAGAFWPWLSAAWVGLVLAAAGLQAGGGTSLYSAIPVRAMNGALFTVLMASGIVIAGLLPWRSWPAELWDRPRLEAAGLTSALMTPIGIYLMIRALDAADGQFPAGWIGPALMVVGLATTVSASVRAQAAGSRRAYLSEMLPATGGFALLALGAGTPLGLAGAVATAAAAAAVAALLPLIPDGGRAGALLSLGLAAGLPPGLTFGARLLDVGAAFESSEAAALLGLVATGAWILGLAGAARAAWLPGRRTTPSAVGARGMSGLVATLILILGVGLGILMTGVVLPAAAAVLRPQTQPVTGGLIGIVTASGAWPALTLAGPLLVLAGLLALASRPVWGAAPATREAVPGPFFRIPIPSPVMRAVLSLRALRVPDEYHSLYDLRAAERRLGMGTPSLWLAVVAALAFVVTR